MGLVNWLQDRWLMMMRTKPQYISMLGRKRSSIRSPPKISNLEDNKCSKKFGSFICVLAMCCSVSYGILLLLFQGISPATTSTFVISLFIAGVASISGGFCLAEYIASQSQDIQSIYSCCYWNSSEVLAFCIGWTWLISQAAIVAGICKVSAIYLNQWTDDAIRKFLENVFFSYADAIPSLFFIVAFTLFIFTGLSETVVWYILFMSVSFILLVIVCAFTYTAMSKEWSFFNNVSWDDVQDIDKILSSSTLCVLFFSGPQSILRIPQTKLRRNVTVILGPLNIVCLAIVFSCLFAASQYEKLLCMNNASEYSTIFASNILVLICLCILGIEALYPLYFVTEDMSSDGLLFRSFSKKWKPLCIPVASILVHVLIATSVGLLSVFLPVPQLLNLSVILPLLVNSIVPFLVLIQRYRDNNSWQYEPMFHTAARSMNHDKSRKKSQELQYTNTPGFDITDSYDLATTCIEENPSESSSDTDIDAVVQQYKDQAKVANMATLEDPAHFDQTPEPTPSSAIRAKIAIAALFAISLSVSITLNFADPSDHFSVIIIVLICILFSTVIQSLLLCLPQNRSYGHSRKCCIGVPNMSWGPGLAALTSSSLMVHSLIQAWKVYLGWFALGVFIYFFYGIRSSTAANSFYHLQPTHINLRPLPSYGNNCIPQIIPSQRKLSKSKKLKKVKGYL